MSLPSEQPLVVGGTTYRLSKFSLPLYEEFLQWCQCQLPDPFANLAERVKGLPDTLAKHMIDKAEERLSKRGSLADPEVQGVAESPAGVRKVFTLLFRKHHPTLTEGQVAEIVEEGIAEHGDTFFRGLFPQG